MIDNGTVVALSAPLSDSDFNDVMNALRFHAGGASQLRIVTLLHNLFPQADVYFASVPSALQ
jgi:hypothetical protein